MDGNAEMSLLLLALRVVFLLLLYGFLGILAWLVWRDLKRGSSGTLPAQQRAGGAHLTVVASGDSGYAEGRQFELGAVTTIGRDLSNDIILGDAYASSHHARVEWHEDNRYWLVDVESSNGTMLNHRKIRPHDPYPLDPGDVISIGKVQLKMEY